VVFAVRVELPFDKRQQRHGKFAVVGAQSRCSSTKTLDTHLPL
jgi:hypothetical protein